MGLVNYSLLFLPVILVFSILVRGLTTEKFQLIYCVVSPVLFVLIYLIIPYVFTYLGDQMFRRPSEDADCGNIYIVVVFLQITHFIVLAPILGMISFVINLIIIKGRFQKRKSVYPNDAEKDKW